MLTYILISATFFSLYVTIGAVIMAGISDCTSPTPERPKKESQEQQPGCVSESASRPCEGEGGALDHDTLNLDAATYTRALLADHGLKFRVETVRLPDLEPMPTRL